MLSPEEAESDPDVRWVHSFFSELRGASEDSLPDTSVLEYMRERGATARQLQLADCKLGKEVPERHQYSEEEGGAVDVIA